LPSQDGKAQEGVAGIAEKTPRFRQFPYDAVWTGSPVRSFGSATCRFNERYCPKPFRLDQFLFKTNRLGGSKIFYDEMIVGLTR
jgi:hypothetical protein